MVERRASHTNCVHGSHYSSSKTDKETRRQTQRQTQRQIKRNTDYHTKQTNLDKDQPCDGILCSPYPSSGLEPNSEACCLLVLPGHRKSLSFGRYKTLFLALSMHILLVLSKPKSPDSPAHNESNWKDGIDSLLSSARLDEVASSHHAHQRRL